MEAMLNNKQSLLLSDEAWEVSKDLYSCWNARGLYNPLQFVLRLRPDVHRALNGAPAGVVTPQQLTEEQIFAFSTYLHENIHWWQHVGSITGLILSLVYPAQSHLNHKHLKAILSELGPIKSLRSYNGSNAKPPDKEGEVDRNINAAINNWHDIEFYRWLITDPERVRVLVDDPYFECVGHSYYMAISAVLWLLSSTVDPQLDVLPDPRKWQDALSALRAEKHPGFFYRSPVIIPPVGAKEIFEGQARFCQLQYLYVSSGRTATWDDFHDAGMFSDVYINAFNHFLSVTGLDRPLSFDDSVIGLFLIVCDISINPSEFFIEEPKDFERLIYVHDPGFRFHDLCVAIKENLSDFEFCIQGYSSNEYWAVSDLLCEKAGLLNPRSLLEEVSSWPQKLDSIKNLLDEDDAFAFSQSNLPVRVFLARYIRLQIDRLKTPEFFCWIGIWMSTLKQGGISPDTALKLFEEHRALFLDREDGDIYPRTFADRQEVAVQETFDSFYSWVAVYELVRQWMVGEGDFDFNFSWLTSKYSSEEMKEWASVRFENVFGVSPSQFEIVKNSQSQ